MASIKDVRNYALQEWAGENEIRQEQVKDFTKACLEGGSEMKQNFDIGESISKENEMPEIFIKACAEKNGYNDLYEVVEK